MFVSGSVPSSVRSSYRAISGQRWPAGATTALWSEALSAVAALEPCDDGTLVLHGAVCKKGHEHLYPALIGEVGKLPQTIRARCEAHGLTAHLLNFSGICRVARVLDDGTRVLIGARLGAPSLLANYKFVRKLGAGSFGEVWRALDKTSQEAVAIKILKPRASLAELTLETQAEVHSLITLKHPNILAYRDAFRAGGNFYIVTEILDTDLFHFVTKTTTFLSPGVIRDKLRDILTGLAHIHSKGYVHRDLKPANVLLTRDGVAKIADLGLITSMQTSSVMLRSDSVAESQFVFVPRGGFIAGTILYMPPEILLAPLQRLGRGQSTYTWPRPSQAMDMWAVGLILVFMILKRHPLPSLTNLRISNAYYLFPYLEKLLGRPQTADTRLSTFMRARYYDLSRIPPAFAKTLRDTAPIATTISQYRAQHVERVQVLDLARKMLAYHAPRRISAADALKHPFLAQS